MRDVKMIQRYAYGGRNNQTVAGVFNTTGVVNFTAKFTVVINSIAYGCRSRDDVTNQGIDGMYIGYLSAAFAAANNPGLIVSDPYLAGVTVRAGHYSQAKTHINVSPGDVVAFAFIIYLMTVTANAINNESLCTLGYLCPEDYLSVDAFAARP